MTRVGCSTAQTVRRLRTGRQLQKEKEISISSCARYQPSEEILDGRWPVPGVRRVAVEE
jgi:hypothetical protein